MNWIYTIFPARPAWAGENAGPIQPIPPEQAAQKIESVAASAYQWLSGLTDHFGVMAVAAVGVLAVAGIFGGLRTLARVVAALACVALGLGLIFGAPAVVGLVKGLAGAVK